MNNRSCPKAGIKIHETRQPHTQNTEPRQHFNNMSVSHLSVSHLSKPVNYYNTTLDSLDLDLDNYSLDDLYHLFNITDDTLNEDALKNAKQIVLKMHPDKSRLDSKYFIFFSGAYKRLYGIYEFQNKSTKRNTMGTEYSSNDMYDESNANVLNQMFKTKKELKDPKGFNEWFNQTFEKHRVNEEDRGYGDWLKSNEGFISVNENITKGNMNEVFEQKKRQIQSIQLYTGVTDMTASTLGGSLLDSSDNFTTDEYTDLRQAYTETLIPVTQEDYSKVRKFNNISEYKAHRDGVDVSPLSQAEANKKLYDQRIEAEKKSAALAYKYALEAEKAKQKQQSFWGDIKLLAGFN